MKLKEVKFNQVIRSILSLIVVVIMIRQFFLKEWFMMFACFYTLVLFSLPRIFDKKFNIKFPMSIEIVIYLFIFASEIMGEIGEYYINITWWDDLLHFTSGMLLVSVGLFFITLVDKKNEKLRLPIFYKIIISFCFTMTILVLWECFEFGVDNLVGADMQKDTLITEIRSVDLNDEKVNKAIKIDIDELIVNGENWIQKYGGYIDIGLYDTMYDLLDGVLGASVFSIISYIYLRKKMNYDEIKNITSTNTKKLFKKMK